MHGICTFEPLYILWLSTWSVSDCDIGVQRGCGRFFHRLQIDCNHKLEVYVTCDKLCHIAVKRGSSMLTSLAPLTLCLSSHPDTELSLRRRSGETASTRYLSERWTCERRSCDHHAQNRCRRKPFRRRKLKPALQAAYTGGEE